MSILLLFGILFTCVTLSLPIGASLGLATAITIGLTTSIPTVMINQNAFAGLDSFPLMAIPFFMLAGNLMAVGGIAKRIVNVCDIMVGKITGGVGMATIAASMFFAAISGSGPATVSAMGTIMLPEMENRGYDKGFATGLTATAGTIGVIIPPSIPFVIYGVVASASIGELFIAGVIPGILIGVALMFVCYCISKKKGYKGTTHDELKFWPVFTESIWALITPVIILGGIYGGVFTPTEAAVVGIVYSFIVGVFIYRELNWHSFIAALRSTADLNGLTGFAIGFSMAFASYLAMEQIPIKVAAVLTSVITNGTVLLLMILVMLLIVGLFVDNISSCLILTPVFLPIVKSLGMDPVQFGVVMTTALAIGFVTPPYGANLFVASAISGLSIERIAKSAIPFLIAMAICLLLITFVPVLTMGLVGLMKS
ncbi:TRAP dicarboxylate transporter, DctM subunit [uncultured delta proteobacterium]|uniref:TRAP dicarboxylate transporter, DctM subunit n=1 Tax=uncultured delta proteobacterium TaxID=34034 RepID=A0A212KE45_9DELT|nr:TRAP dicarboxylate transporter, DctM subunit [uncultured delta proteobacterium]